MYKGFNLIKCNQGERRFIAVGIFVGWLSFQAQSFISIDNIGISIWGWILGGAIIGLSFSDIKVSNLSIKTKTKVLL